MPSSARSPTIPRFGPSESQDLALVANGLGLAFLPRVGPAAREVSSFVPSWTLSCATSSWVARGGLPHQVCPGYDRIVIAFTQHAWFQVEVDDPA
jgi:hypothetical protein